MNKLIYIIIFVLLIPPAISAQHISWADKIVSISNISPEKGSNSDNIIGKPDAIQGVSSEGGVEVNGFDKIGKIEVEFEKPHQVQTVVIIENYAPGKVTKVILTDIKGNEIEVYKSAPENMVQNVNWHFIKVPLTEEKIKTLKLSVSSIGAEEMPQIDAVGISRTADIPLLRRELLAMNLPSAGNNPDLKIKTGREHLGPAVNYPEPELYPLISADGETLFFNRKNFSKNKRGRKDKGDIYLSNALGNSFVKGKNLSELNTRKFDRLLSIGADGATYLISGKTPNADRGLLITYRSGNGWTDPVPISVSGLAFDGMEMDAVLSPSGKQMILSFASKKDGDKDLYVAFKQNNLAWSAPIPLKGVKSGEDDYAPFLAADGKTLYFSSKGFGGMGGSDIYVSRRLDDTYRNWSKPENIGGAVNTIGDEEYFTVTAKGDYGYFTSNQNSYDSKEDIYRILLNINYKPDPVVLMSGQVFERKSKDPVDASIILTNLENGNAIDRFNNSLSEGFYQFIIPSGKYYDFTAVAEGYLSFSENVDLRDLNFFQEIRRDLKLYPKEVGEIIPLDNILFEEAKAIILPASKSELNQLIKMMVDNPNLKIELGGHTDNRGSFENKLELSQKRVDAVKQVLVQAGISPDRISTVGYGDKKPIAPNDTEENMAKNRRVEVKILEI
ncbi:OmpA family protein [Mangrovivirga cuniculi]|uniref:OmpA-like domain-containing protein n=1 Tax=Mangrovivirga cuniculi TaxID=2715131 RepID=A0A4D7JM97_9BACT|nr:OmpA family protein [Mangrovivirga cuniculi]QCK15993.1 hypothetical protein DCC35_15225 [Mangrovivirga cuniculi]